MVLCDISHCILTRGNAKFAMNYADVAQLVEQLIRNQQVAGSSPAISSNFYFRQFSNKFDKRRVGKCHAYIEKKKGRLI